MDSNFSTFDKVDYTTWFCQEFKFECINCKSIFKCSQDFYHTENKFCINCLNKKNNLQGNKNIFMKMFGY